MWKTQRSLNAAILAMCMPFLMSASVKREKPAALSCGAPGGILEVSWEPVTGADRYDLQMGIEGIDDSFGGHHPPANATSVAVEHLIPRRKYWFQLFAHFRTDQVLGSWRAVSAKQVCTAPPAPAGPDPAASYSRRRGFFTVDMIRHSSFSDGLEDRNSGDAKGQAGLLSTHFHLKDCTMALYRVHVKNCTFANQVTPAGNGAEHFANYESCNPDESTGGYLCAPIEHADCCWFGHQKDCTAAGNTTYAKDHVGMGVIYCPEDGPAPASTSDGRWYSTPRAGLAAGNWKRDAAYLRAPCYDSMSEWAIKEAFELAASMYATPWTSDVPAFSTELSAATDKALVV